MDEVRKYLADKAPDHDPERETLDDFLGGAVRLIQPRDGYRVSMDTVLLAAAVPARSGEQVMEGGVGTGGAALCLARRVDGAVVHGLDIQDSMVTAARRNVAFNELEDKVRIEPGSVTDLGDCEGQYHHVMLNPPYLADGRGVRPPAENKGLAHMDDSADLKDWVRFALYCTKARGSITLIHRADRLDELMARLHRSAGDITVLPLWPRYGKAAKRVIVQARKGTGGPTRLLPGLALHGEVDRYTPEVRRILWDGDALDLKNFARGGQTR